ncbi:MAG: hypothetical protein QG575_1938 [Euryarchaeota archaeon]|nr:hypothetical protein [Euryarchaeota archaeon]
MSSQIFLLLAIVLMISNLSISLAMDPVENESEMPAYIPENGQIEAMQTVLLNTTIGTNLSSFSFILTWTNATSGLEATLTSPSGTKIDSTAELPVIYGTNESLIFYILPNPEAGKWTAAITARNVPDVGETYLVLFNTTYVDKFTQQGSIDEEMNLNDLEDISGECENCSEES